MRNALPCLLVAICFLSSGHDLSAQQSSAQVSYEARIRELLEITGSGELGKQVLEQIVGTMKQGMPQVPESFWREFMAEVDAEKIVEIVVPIYAKHFTEEEVDAMLEFYKTDVGQSVIHKLPIVTRESMQAGNLWGQEIAERAIRKLHEKGYEIQP